MENPSPNSALQLVNNFGIILVESGRYSKAQKGYSMSKVITAEVWYKARIRRTGEIIEGHDFLDVYNAVERTIKDFLYHGISPFDSIVTHIDCGILHRYNDGTEEFMHDHSVCLLGASKAGNKISFYTERME